MTPFERFLATQPTIDALDGFDRQAATDMGVRPAVASAWGMVHDTYYGPTKWTAQQRTALGKAHEAGHDLDRLIYIERRLSTVDDAGERWALRHALLDVRGSFARLKTEADAIVPKKAPAASDRGLRFGASKRGMRGIYINATERFAADLEHRLRLDIDPAAGADAQQMYDAFEDMLCDEAGGGVTPAAPQPLVLVPLAHHTCILDGDGDDTVVQLSDGTTMTGAEYLNLLRIGGAGGEGAPISAALFHPLAGPVNAYRQHRLANPKQRILAKAMSPACAVPGCRHSSETCEIHHIQAWSRGGNTNIMNLIPLCKYHNRVNDDIRERRRRGYATYVDGRPVWISPRGYPVPAAVPGAMERLFGALDSHRAPGTSMSS